MKLAIISVLAGVSALVATALPWLESAPIQRADCIVVKPYAVVCPTTNPT